MTRAVLDMLLMPASTPGLSARPSPSKSHRLILRHFNILLARLHLSPIFDLSNVDPSYLLGVLEALLGITFDAFHRQLAHNDALQRRHEERTFARFIILGLRQSLNPDTVFDGGSKDVEEWVESLVTRRRQGAIEAVLEAIVELATRLEDQQRERSYTPSSPGISSITRRSSPPSFSSRRLSSASNSNSSEPTPIPSTPRKLLFTDRLPPPFAGSEPSLRPRLQTTPRRSIVELVLRSDTSAKARSPIPLFVRPTSLDSISARPRGLVPVVRKKDEGAVDVFGSTTRKEELASAELEDRRNEGKEEEEDARGAASTSQMIASAIVDEKGFGDEDSTGDDEQCCCNHDLLNNSLSDDLFESSSTEHEQELKPDIPSQLAHRPTSHVRGTLSRMAISPPPGWTASPRASSAKAHFVLRKGLDETSGCSSTEDEYVAKTRRRKGMEEVESKRLRAMGLISEDDLEGSILRGWRVEDVAARP